MATTVSRRGMDEIQKYLMMRANKSMESGDSTSAKSWLLTTSVLFPHSFRLQYDRYLIAKKEQNVTEATICMSEMLENPDSSDYPELKQETKSMVDIVRFDDDVTQNSSMKLKALSANNPQSTASMTDEEKQFLRHVFNRLSDPAKHKILTSVATASDTSWFDLCHLTLISLKLIPGSVKQGNHQQNQGRKLLQQIDHARKADVANERLFIQMMIHDALPLLLKADSGVSFEAAEITMRLITCMEYFVMNSSITRSNLSDQEDSELESQITHVFHLAYKKMTWDQSLVPGDGIDPEVILQRITTTASGIAGSSVKQEPGASDAPIDLSVPSHKKQRSNSHNTSALPAVKPVDPILLTQLLFSSMILFLKCLRQYARSLSPSLTLIAVTDHAPGAAAAAASTGTSSRQQPDIRSKTMSEQKLRQSFLTCTQCMDMVIRTEVMVSDFFPLLRQVGAEECLVYGNLRRDAVLFKGQAGEFVRITVPIIASASGIPAAGTDPQYLGLSLQLVSACLTMHDHNSAIRHAVSCVQMLSGLGKKLPAVVSEDEKNETATDAKSGKAAATASGFQYLSLTPESVLHYCINSLITCLRFTTLLSVSPSDSGIGHLIVLSQYQWPRHADLFQSCLSLISHKHAQTFAYQPFAVFVREPDILEHFMCLCERLTLNLGLTSVTIKSLSQRQQQSMTTRGVHKGVKEEQRNSLIKQMTDCTSLIEPQMFIEFVLTVLAHA